MQIPNLYVQGGVSGEGLSNGQSPNRSEGLAGLFASLLRSLQVPVPGSGGTAPFAADGEIKPADAVSAGGQTGSSEKQEVPVDAPKVAASVVAIGVLAESGESPPPSPKETNRKAVVEPSATVSASPVSTAAEGPEAHANSGVASRRIPDVQPSSVQAKAALTVEPKTSVASGQLASDEPVRQVSTPVSKSVSDRRPVIQPNNQPAAEPVVLPAANHSSEPVSTHRVALVQTSHEVQVTCMQYLWAYGVDHVERS